MRKKENYFFIFVFFLILSVALFKFLGLSPFFGISQLLENSTVFLQSKTYDLLNLPKIFGNTEVEKLKEENAALYKKLVNQQELERENSALRDQFRTIFPVSSTLLPAKIIGAPSFIPGVNAPESFTLDKGTKDKVKVGQAVIFKDNLIGKISRVSLSLSVVELLTNKDSLLTVRTLKTNALGVVKGQGNGEMILENVLLSENLMVLDVVETLDDPGNLVVGKIESVDKKPSSLFQAAKIKSIIDFSKLSTVFIIIGG